MFARRVSTIFGAAMVVALTAAAAHAQSQDAVEAKAQACAACHGQNGVPLDPKTVPIIWGQQVSYLVKQLTDYRSGERDNPIMTPIAKELAQADLRKLAAYFAAKPWPEKEAPPAAAPASLPKGMAQCQPCHQQNFEGGMPAPRIAGLSYEYLVASMRAFATDERSNNGDMPKFMQMLSDDERDAMARYLAVR